MYIAFIKLHLLLTNSKVIYCLNINLFFFLLRFSKNKTGIKNIFTLKIITRFVVGVILNAYCLVFKTFISIRTKYPNNLVLESHSLVNKKTIQVNNNLGLCLVLGKEIFLGIKILLFSFCCNFHSTLMAVSWPLTEIWPRKAMCKLRVHL